MLRHIVFFTAKDPKDRDAIFEGLSLLKEIPHSLHFEIGINQKSDPIAGLEPDFIVYGEFADAEQMAAFKAHNLYQVSIDRVRPLRDQRIAADFLSA